jgi:hypothetical protein
MTHYKLKDFRISSGTPSGIRDSIIDDLNKTHKGIVDNVQTYLNYTVRRVPGLIPEDTEYIVTVNANITSISETKVYELDTFNVTSYKNSEGKEQFVSYQMPRKLPPLRK